jgi:hypothetical protein
MLVESQLGHCSEDRAIKKLYSSERKREEFDAFILLLSIASALPPDHVRRLHRNVRIKLYKYECSPASPTRDVICVFTLRPGRERSKAPGRIFCFWKMKV